jgi:hypothetical protein
MEMLRCATGFMGSNEARGTVLARFNFERGLTTEEVLNRRSGTKNRRKAA